MKGKPITCRLMIPDGKGYQEWHDLNDAEKEEFGKQCANRMGQALNERFSTGVIPTGYQERQRRHYRH